jgi:putative salt-induced outer membrane protein
VVSTNDWTEKLEMKMHRKLYVPFLILALVAAPALAEEAEESPPEPAWTGSLGLGWLATSGNSDTSSFGLDFGLDRKPEPWGLSFAARANRADNDGELTAENYFVAARAVRKINDRWEGFGGLQWSKDPFTGFDSQTIASAGATYIAISDDLQVLSFDAGLAYTWEDRVPPGGSIDYFGGVLGLYWERKLGASSKLTERLMFYPNFDTSSDWRLTSVTGIEAAVNSWLALRFGFDLRYRNEPIGDAESTDTTSTASVVFTF